MAGAGDEAAKFFGMSFRTSADLVNAVAEVGAGFVSEPTFAQQLIRRKVMSDE